MPEIPEGYDPQALLSRFEWKHLMTSARRHAREEEQRYAVIGRRGADGRWHYVLAPSSSSLVKHHELTREWNLTVQDRRREKLADAERFYPRRSIDRSLP